MNDEVSTDRAFDVSGAQYAWIIRYLTLFLILCECVVWLG